ncbi:hypothetical protein JANAI62_19530 [Jannaschia pagri]|uniref:Secreted protein n=1 Tax=Jannaschia pagri TaxID=2829797 RepID=A0ABQ4NLP7_9RHOB|nr:MULTISPECIES: hypothetical protein [unclassified Jannaschia]GIT91496.1 hypothetical protein JANAI61_19540 [Jannaschia sp. AI_61]GIT95330.1 hypothetical protein JANAI62_19530 [Jannaschia sp. AI_62]
MFRQLSAAILSIALALPMTTAPARADAEDVAKVLGGLAALYVLKEAIDRRNDRRDHSATRNQTHRPGVHHHHRHRDGTWHRHSGGNARHSHDHARHTPPRHNNRVNRVPDRCARYLNTNRGQVLAYGARCMQRHVARPGSLPPQCIRRVNTDRGLRTVYGRGCLRREGWAMARR